MLNTTIKTIKNEYATTKRLVLHLLHWPILFSTIPGNIPFLGHQFKSDNDTIFASTLRITAEKPRYMESQEVIRAYMLEPGDVFKIGESCYRVRRIAAGMIYYYSYYADRPECGGTLKTMGQFSQERVILITNKIKQNEHQNRSGNFSKS